MGWWFTAKDGNEATKGQGCSPKDEDERTMTPPLLSLGINEQDIANDKLVFFSEITHIYLHQSD